MLLQKGLLLANVEGLTSCSAGERASFTKDPERWMIPCGSTNSAGVGIRLSTAHDGGKQVHVV